MEADHLPQNIEVSKPRPLDGFELQELSSLQQRAKYDRNLTSLEEVRLAELKELFKHSRSKK